MFWDGLRAWFSHGLWKVGEVLIRGTFAFFQLPRTGWIANGIALGAAITIAVDALMKNVGRSSIFAPDVQGNLPWVLIGLMFSAALLKPVADLAKTAVDAIASLVGDDPSGMYDRIMADLSTCSWECARALSTLRDQPVTKRRQEICGIVATKLSVAFDRMTKAKSDVIVSIFDVRGGQPMDRLAFIPKGTQPTNYPVDAVRTPGDAAHRAIGFDPTTNSFSPAVLVYEDIHFSRFLRKSAKRCGLFPKGGSEIVVPIEVPGCDSPEVRYVVIVYFRLPRQVLARHRSVYSRHITSFMSLLLHFDESSGG
jgi:hypothetical protein